MADISNQISDAQQAFASYQKMILDMGEEEKIVKNSALELTKTFSDAMGQAADAQNKLTSASGRLTEKGFDKMFAQLDKSAGLAQRQYNNKLKEISQNRLLFKKELEQKLSESKINKKDFDNERKIRLQQDKELVKQNKAILKRNKAENEAKLIQLKFGKQVQESTNKVTQSLSNMARSITKFIPLVGDKIAVAFDSMIEN